MTRSSGVRKTVRGSVRRACKVPDSTLPAANVKRFGYHLISELYPSLACNALHLKRMPNGRRRAISYNRPTAIARSVSFCTLKSRQARTGQSRWPRRSHNPSLPASASAAGSLHSPSAFILSAATPMHSPSERSRTAVELRALVGGSDPTASVTWHPEK
jgi:hypothetical protein